MAPVSFNSNTLPLSKVLDEVPHSDSPLTHIPKYIFENCNQVTCHSYSDKLLETLKKGSQNLNVELLKKVYKEKENAYVNKLEELNWIYGLDRLEKELLPLGPRNIETALSVEKVMQYNGYLSREIADSDAGKMRTRNISWSKGDKNFIEKIAASLFELKIEEIYGPNFLVSPSSGNKKFFMKKKELISKMTGKLVLRYEAKDENYINQGLASVTPEKVEEAVNQWIKGQGNKKERLDIIKWLKDNHHYFPSADKIPQELENSLKKIQDDKMHPIEKACRLWYDIVRIHISHEANKRSGKGRC